MFIITWHALTHTFFLHPFLHKCPPWCLQVTATFFCCTFIFLLCKKSDKKRADLKQIHWTKTLHQQIQDSSPYNQKPKITLVSKTNATSITLEIQQNSAVKLIVPRVYYSLSGSHTPQDALFQTTVNLKFHYILYLLVSPLLYISSILILINSERLFRYNTSSHKNLQYCS